MSIAPCCAHTQLYSGRFGDFLYLPFTISVSHCTREKLTRHRSPSFGGTATNFVSTSSLMLFHGHLISSVQPLSVSHGLFSVPSIFTAVFNPVISHECTAVPESRYGLVSSKSQVVLSAFSSSSP